MAEVWKGPLEKLDAYRWRIPRSYKPFMRVDGIIYASETLIQQIRKDQAPEQVANVAALPGILKYSLAMPDIHWGYGFPIGGVAAMDPDSGVISPGGVGYDINCGVRLLRSDLTLEDLKPYLDRLADALFRNVPAGVGVGGRVKVSHRELEEVMVKGSAWVVQQGYGWESDLERTEAYGTLSGANPDAVSRRARERGRPQLGSLGSGNHFLEVQVVEEVYDERAARAMGLFQGGITVMIHCGSRGFGHQICDDYVRTMGRVMEKYGIQVPDRQLASVPIQSPEGKAYFSAMVAAANYAWANRQFITHWVRESFREALKKTPESLGLHMVYDVAHNIAKFEEHEVDGRKRTVLVHRKGATRAFPKGHPELAPVYRPIGQPVLIPGDMGTNSYVLVGTETAMKQSFGSTCHGAGRALSRAAAKRAARGRRIIDELRARGIVVRAHTMKGLMEEIPEAYKDVSEVVEVVHRAGLSRKVARLRPVIVVKG